MSFRIRFRDLTDAAAFASRIHASSWKATCLRSGLVVYLSVPEMRVKRLTEVVGILGGEMRPLDRRHRRLGHLPDPVVSDEEAMEIRRRVE